MKTLLSSGVFCASIKNKISFWRNKIRLFNIPGFPVCIKTKRPKLFFLKLRNIKEKSIFMYINGFSLFFF